VEYEHYDAFLASVDQAVQHRRYSRLPQEVFATEHAERLLFDAAMGGMWSGVDLVGVASTPWAYRESIGR
jgi:hypothetical protein